MSSMHEVAAEGREQYEQWQAENAGLTDEQVREAILQMKTQCDLHMPGYEPVSARMLLNELGYEAHVEQVLAAIAAGGFDYCLDHSIECSNGSPDKPGRMFPSQQVCYWGPDQLKSRLEFVR